MKIHLKLKYFKNIYKNVSEIIHCTTVWHHYNVD